MPHFLSDAFFHLVGRRAPTDDEANYTTLKSILDSECLRNTSAGDGRSPTSVSVDLTKTLVSGELVVPTMTCYCDIPLDDLPFHASKYGRFGLGFPRDFLIDRGARPVSYFPLRADDWRGIRGATVLKDIESIYRAFHDRLLTPTRERNPGRHPRGVGNAPESDDAAIEQINAVLTMHFLGYLKPYDSLLQQDHPDYYYAEREWRSTIYQRFIPDDVSHIIVADGFGERARKELPPYATKVHELPHAH